MPHRVLSSTTPHPRLAPSFLSTGLCCRTGRLADVAFGWDGAFEARLPGRGFEPLIADHPPVPVSCGVGTTGLGVFFGVVWGIYALLRGFQLQVEIEFWWLSDHSGEWRPAVDHLTARAAAGPPRPAYSVRRQASASGAWTLGIVGARGGVVGAGGCGGSGGGP